MPNNFESFNNNNETYNTESTVPQVSKELAHKFGATAYADHREAEGAMENGASDTPSEDMDMMFQEKVVETPEIPQQEAQEPGHHEHPQCGSHGPGGFRQLQPLPQHEGRQAQQLVCQPRCAAVLFLLL